MTIPVGNTIVLENGEMEMNGKLRNMASLYISKGNKMLLLFRQGGRVVNNVWVGSAGGHFESFELNDARACVLKKYRHNNIGKELLEYAFSGAEKMGCCQVNIGIVEENVKLRDWYEENGAKHVRTEK